MSTSRSTRRGQTTIETALMMILLFIFFFAIAEIARAWWFKNQIGNAARVGARAAIVSSTLASVTNVACGSSDTVVAATCNAITSDLIRNEAHVSVAIEDTNVDGVIPDGGDAVTVTVTSTFHSAVSGLARFSFGFIPDNQPLTAAIKMRYE